MDLEDITLLCMTFWTLCRRSTASGARKPKVSKANGIKACWLSEHAFSCLASLLDATFRAVCPTVKGLTPNPTSGETPVKSTQTCFPPTHPYTITSAGLNVDLLSSGSVKKFIGASFFTDIPARLNISKSTSLTKSCLYLNPGSSLQWTTYSPKVSRHALRQTGHTSSIGNSGIIKRYLRIVRYSTGDICWHNPSIGIARRKSWACVACKHPKIAFCLVVMSNLTSISWTLLLKVALAKTCYALGGTMSLLVKLLTSKFGIVPRRPSKALSKSESMPHNSRSLKIWSCNTQDCVLEVTKAYEEAFNVGYKPNPPNLIGKEANLYWRSLQKEPPPTTMSSTASCSSLSNNIAASSMWIGWHVLKPKKSLAIPMHDRSRRSSLWEYRT